MRGEDQIAHRLHGDIANVYGRLGPIGIHQRFAPRDGNSTARVELDALVDIKVISGRQR